MAGVTQHRKIIEKTVANTDQDHLEVVHFQFPKISDRTGFLLDKNSNLENPGKQMSAMAVEAQLLAMHRKRTVISVVSCNTFHSDAVYSDFQGVIDNLNGEKKFGDVGYIKNIHLIEECIKYLSSNNFKKIGLMSTTGTRRSGVYLQSAQKLGLELVEVDEKDQEVLHDSIYNQEYGLKCLSRCTPEVRQKYEGFVKQLKEKGADCVICGCTEIPIALPDKELFGLAVVDPMDVAAQIIVDTCQ